MVFLFQIMYDILYHPNSANDVGTMCSNMNVTNNINAKTKNVLDNFNYYVKIETEAFVVSAFMAHFKMEVFEDNIDIPSAVLNGTKEGKVLWLHQHMKEMLEKFIMTKQTVELQQLIQEVTNANTPDPPQPKAFPCRCCGKSYVYKKCRDRHESKLHPDFTQPIEETKACDSTEIHKEKAEDCIYNYACARLGLGLLLHNFDDAVKEGDGERILRCWKFLLLIFKCYNHHKYALASLQLLANVNAMLSPRKAHSLVWNRTINNKGGKGKNISLDLRMEHIVHLHKEMLANLGVNLTPECALRCSRAIQPVEDLLRTVDDELLCKRPSGKHTVTRSQKDFKLIVNELHNKGKVFQCTQSDNRQYQCFPEFKKTLVNELNYNHLNNWINQHKKQWSNKGK